MCWCFGTCDPAASERDSADYTALGAWCVTPGKDLLCLEVVRKHLSVEAIVASASVEAPLASTEASLWPKGS
jgi:hypothetical protein